MKLARLAALLLCLVAPRAMAAIAYDATAGHSGNNSTNAASTTVTITMVAGETGVCFVYGNGAAITGITGGGTWTQITSIPNSSLWWTGAGGATTASSITVSAGAGAFPTIAVCGQYIGAAGSAIQVQTDVVGYTTQTNLPTINNSVLGSFYVGGILTDGSNFTPVASNATVRQSNTTGAGAYILALVDSETVGSLATLNLNCTSTSATSDDMMGFELLPASPNPFIQYDYATADSGGGTGTTSPITATLTVKPGETGFCAIGFYGTVAGDSATSITGGGTWTLVKAFNAAASARAELWTNGPNGGATASSVSIAFTGTVVDVSAYCSQYIGAGQILTANATTASGTLSLSALSLTTLNLNSFVVSAWAAKGTTPTFTTPSAGVIRGQTAGSTVSAAGALDNASPTAANTSITPTKTGTFQDWAAVAVELALPSAGVPWMMTGFGQ